MDVTSSVLPEDVNTLTFLNILVSSLWPSYTSATVYLSRRLDEQDKVEYRAAVLSSVGTSRGMIIRPLTKIEVASSRGEVLLKLLENVESLAEIPFQTMEKNPQGNLKEGETGIREHELCSNDE